MNNVSKYDRLVSSLCDQIDDLEAEVEYWKSKYEEEVRESIQTSNERLEQARKGVANALMFALSVRDDENGNLVIPKEERKALAENWK